MEGTPSRVGGRVDGDVKAVLRDPLHKGAPTAVQRLVGDDCRNVCEMAETLAEQELRTGRPQTHVVAQNVPDGQPPDSWIEFLIVVKGDEATESRSDQMCDEICIQSAIGDDAGRSPFAQKARCTRHWMSTCNSHVPARVERGMAQHAAKKVPVGLLPKICLNENACSQLRR